jgi:hypothetical protein
MERTKPPSSIVRIANAVIRPNPWLISRKTDPIDGVEKSIYRYGEYCKVIVNGRLYEKDFGTWLCMLDIAKRNNYRPYKSDNLCVDIAKEMGAKNPYQRTVLEPLWHSIDRLLDTQIRIRPDKGRGFTAKFCLIEGWLDSDCRHGSFSVTPYLDIVKELMLGQTIIVKQLYFNLNSTIARSLYKFLASQKSFYRGTEYKIRLSQLCKYLNYDLEDKPWWQVWDSIENAIKELKQAGFISRYRYNKNHYKQNGGMLSFYPAQKKPKITTDNSNSEVVQLIKDVFEDKIQWSISYEIKLRTALNNTYKFLEQYAVSLKSFIKNYCGWLKHKNPKYISPKLFEPENMFFQEFVKLQRDDGFLMTEKEYKRRNPEPKPLTEDEKKQQAEKDKEWMEKRKKIKDKCPHEYIFGEDCERCNYLECEKRSKCLDVSVDLFSDL